jgi:penicillin amidase
VRKEAPNIREYNEQIRSAGKPVLNFTIGESDGNPILAGDGDGHLLALRWVAQQPGAINFNLANMVFANDIESAFSIADRAGVPAQNFMIADANGKIGWRIIGARAQRPGFCGTPVVSARDCRQDWDITTTDAPHIINPDSHRLWTANNRTLDGSELAEVGDGGYVNGARAKQIRDDLFAKDQFNEKDLLAIQLDDRALFLERWHTLLQSENNKGAALSELAQAAQHWDGHASPDSVSYRIVRAWRLAVQSRIADGLTAPAQVALGKDFDMPSLPQIEGVTWPLLEQRPMNLLPKTYATWDALLEDAAQQVRNDLAKRGPLAQRRWGELNTAQICHPLANALPAPLKSTLCMNADELSGDSHMPRVTAPAFGASERMVVSPGHEADGIFHMPGGQSGNPLSPFWGAGHEAWVKGEATPFLPGETKYVLKMTP